MIFGTRSITDAATRVDARHQADIKAWWRDWHRYLQAHRQLLEARHGEATHAPSFERTEEAWEEQRAVAEQTLKRIPHDRRVVFDRTRDARRVDVQAQLEANHRGNGAARQGGLDPDVVERETLERLIEQAEGSGEGPERWGTVPLPNGWYELQVGALLQAPAAAEYTVALDDADARRKRLALIAGLLVVAVVAVWWTWPRGSSAAGPVRDPAMEVAGQAAQPWQVVAVTAIDDHGVRTTLPLTTTDASTWPTVPASAQAGWWRRTALLPLELCVPPAILAATRTVEVQGSGDVPIRTYALVAEEPDLPDLHVSACTSDSSVRPRSGMLEGASPRPDQPLQQPVLVGTNGPELRVTGIDVLGVGQDPQVPADTYRIVVRVTPLTPANWTALDPRLRLRTGLESLPSAPINTEENQEGVDVVYLVPAFAAPLEAAWSVTDPATKAQVRWRVTLNPPRSRATVLRDSFEITVTGERGEAANSATVRLELRNTSDATLAITNDDLTVTQQDRTFPMTALGGAGVAVKPLEVRTLEVPLRGIDWTKELRVRLGAAGFRLQF